MMRSETEAVVGGRTQPRAMCALAGASLPAGIARPRCVRVAGARSLVSRKRLPVSPQSPPSPNQESAVNPRTGKVAFGPWLGPVAAAGPAVPDATPSLAPQHSGALDSAARDQETLRKAAAQVPGGSADQQRQRGFAVKPRSQAAAGKAAPKPYLSGRSKRAGTRAAINQPRRQA